MDTRRYKYIALRVFESNLLRLRVNQHIVPLNLDRIGWHRDNGRQRARTPRLQIKLRAMQRTLDAGAIDIPLGERRLLMTASITNRIEIAVNIEDGDRLIFDLHPNRLPRRNRANLRNLNE